MENDYDVFPATIGFDINIRSGRTSPKSFIQNKTMFKLQSKSEY